MLALEQGGCSLAAARPAGCVWIDHSASSTTHAHTHTKVCGCQLKGGLDCWIGLQERGRKRQRERRKHYIGWEIHREKSGHTGCERQPARADRWSTRAQRIGTNRFRVRTVFPSKLPDHAMHKLEITEFGLVEYIKNIFRQPQKELAISPNTLRSPIHILISRCCTCTAATPHQHLPPR